MRQARAAGVVDRPAALQDLLLGPVIVLDIYLVARAPGRFLQRIIDPAELVGSREFVLVLGVYLGAIGLFVACFPRGFKAPRVLDETHSGAVGVSLDFVIPFGKVEAPRMAAFTVAGEPKSTQQNDLSANLAQRGDMARRVEQIGIIVHNIGESRRNTVIGSLIVAARCEHDKRFFRVFAQKRFKVPDDIGEMQIVLVFFE